MNKQCEHFVCIFLCLLFVLRCLLFAGNHASNLNSWACKQSGILYAQLFLYKVCVCVCVCVCVSCNFLTTIAYQSSTEQSTYKSTIQCIKLLINQSINLQINSSINQSMKKVTNKPTNLSIIQPTNQPISIHYIKVNNQSSKIFCCFIGIQNCRVIQLNCRVKFKLPCKSPFPTAIQNSTELYGNLRV